VKHGEQLQMLRILHGLGMRRRSRCLHGTIEPLSPPFREPKAP